MIASFSSMVLLVCQLNLTTDGNPKTGSKETLSQFFVAGSLGYPEPYSLLNSRFSTTVQLAIRESLETCKALLGTLIIELVFILAIFFFGIKFQRQVLTFATMLAALTTGYTESAFMAAMHSMPGNRSLRNFVCLVGSPTVSQNTCQTRSSSDE